MRRLRLMAQPTHPPQPRPKKGTARRSTHSTSPGRQTDQLSSVENPQPMLAQTVFWTLAIVTVGSAAITAFSRNIVYSAFALFGAFAGVAGIYILLAADFLFIIQIFIYIGGILVVT